MKEIIYLDTKLVNSLLAQLNEGLINKLIQQNGESTGNQETKTESNQHQVSGSVGVPGTVNFGANYTEGEATAHQQTFLKNTQKLIETALDDYSLDILINTLVSEEKIKDTNYKDGDIVKITGELTAYNFKQLEEALDLETIEFLLPDYQNFKQERAEYDKIKNNPKHFKRTQELRDSLSNRAWNNSKN